jgi:hypothetical protein
MLMLLVYGGTIAAQVACVVHCVKLGRNQLWIGRSSSFRWSAASLISSSK